MLDLQGVKLKSIANHYWKPVMVFSASNPHEINISPDHHNHNGETWRPYIKAPMTADMTNDFNRFEELTETFLKEAEMNQKTRRCRRIYLKVLSRFITCQGLTLEAFISENLKEYFAWLIRERNFQGLYFQPRTVFMIFSISKRFLIWLGQKGLIAFNAPPEPEELSVSALETICKTRREELQKERLNIPDADILKNYETHIRQYRQTHFKMTYSILDAIKKHLGSTVKKLRELVAGDYEAIREKLFSMEGVPDRKLSQKSLVQLIMYERQFEYWLYEEGYILKDFLKSWTKPYLRIFVNQKLNEIKSSAPVRDRYYSVAEIMRAYKSQVSKRIKDYYQYQQIINNINFFLQFLVIIGKTIYTATETTIEEYRNYILNYEYRPGRHYQTNSQLLMIYHVRRFYDWLLINKYCEHHPLKGFKYLDHKKWLKQNVKPNNKSEKQKNWFDGLIEEFKRYEEHKEYTGFTIRRHYRGCLFFFKYLYLSGIEDLKEVTRETICHYLFYLKQYKNEKGELLSRDNQIRHIASVKAFFQYLEKYGLIEGILSVAVEYPKNDRGLPTPGFNNQEAKQLIESAKGETPKSLRDRVFFELLYSSGMRSNEMCQLKMNNIDLINGMVRIDVPKGGKQYERVIPIGKTTCFWIERYLKEIRSKQTKSPYLFLNRKGSTFITATVLNAVKTHLLKFIMVPKK